MEDLPDLSELGLKESHALIHILWGEIKSLRKEVATLKEESKLLKSEVADLKSKLAKNSRNSSKPPSTDGFDKDMSSDNKKSGKGRKKKSGGQKGHKGSNLKQVDNPDHIVPILVKECERCGESLKDVEVKKHECRQTFDTPESKIEVTEHQAEVKICSKCGHENRAEFPSDVLSPVQYGPRIKALSVYLKNYQLLPYKRLGELFGDIFNHSISPSTLVSMNKTCFDNLKETEEIIKAHVTNSDNAHFDETGHYVEKHRDWLHTASTEESTYYFSHYNRGQLAMDEMGILSKFSGRAIHDYWQSYYKYECEHGLCNAHHLRELTFIHEHLGQKWAERMSGFLLHVKEVVKRKKALGKTHLTDDMLKKFEQEYQKILTSGFRINLMAGKIKGKRGKTAQSVPWNLLNRFKTRRDEVLAFMYDLDVPFTNNLAERDLRMMKVQQKISGTFRSKTGAEHFCRIRGYISTVRKNSINVMDSVFSAVKGKPLLPLHLT